jgi:hypothetical protein
MSIVSVVALTAAPRAAQERRTNHGNEGSNPLERGREVSAPRSEELTPFFNLHREVNRLFDDAFLRPASYHPIFFAERAMRRLVPVVLNADLGCAGGRREVN